MVHLIPSRGLLCLTYGIPSPLFPWPDLPSLWDTNSLPVAYPALLMGCQVPFPWPNLPSLWDAKSLSVAYSAFPVGTSSLTVASSTLPLGLESRPVAWAPGLVAVLLRLSQIPEVLILVIPF